MSNLFADAFTSIDPRTITVVFILFKAFINEKQNPVYGRLNHKSFSKSYLRRWGKAKYCFALRCRQKSLLHLTRKNFSFAGPDFVCYV